MVVPHTAQEQERLEILQDVIDRLLYLPPDKHKEFMEYLSALFSVYRIECQVIDGIRIYNVKRNQHAAQ
jgi:hypothetical protein